MPTLGKFPSPSPKCLQAFAAKHSGSSTSSSLLAMAGPQCWVPAPHADLCCVGKEETVGPFLAYTSSHPTPSAAVILASDGFGFDAPLLRKLADNVASGGYYAVVPDFFKGDPYVTPETGNTSSAVADWMKKHDPLDSVEGAKEVIDCLHKKGYSNVGAVGFCWGGKVVVELAKSDCLKAAVLAHPSRVTVEDIKDVKTPIAILAAETDRSTPPELVEKFVDILEAKPELESFAHIYPGVAHGWTCRYNPDDPKEVANAEEAHNKMLEWFGKFLG